MADGHLTKEPNETVCTGVVSLRNLRLAMLLAELNNLQLWGADVGKCIPMTCPRYAQSTLWYKVWRSMLA